MRSTPVFKRVAAIPVAILLGVAISAQADWFPGDSYKMHYPQLPDPNGWDVNFAYPKILADDWLCTETGPVSDIHFWYSYKYDQQFPIEGIHLSIHSDVPADPSGGFSHPGDLLWERNLSPGEWAELYPYPGPGGTGDQGWYDPNTGEVLPFNHFLTGQINIRIPNEEAFLQEAGTIYWLDISVLSPFSGTNAPIDFGVGWKTSLEHFNDDAVWGDDLDGDGKADFWSELRDPITQESLDLAFVITTVPEPSAILLCTLSGGLWLAWRRRFSKS